MCSNKIGTSRNFCKALMAINFDTISLEITFSNLNIMLNKAFNRYLMKDTQIISWTYLQLFWNHTISFFFWFAHCQKKAYSSHFMKSVSFKAMQPQKCSRIPSSEDAILGDIAVLVLVALNCWTIWSRIFTHLPQYLHIFLVT